MRILSIDFETFASRDIKALALENYIAQPDFAVTAMAWAFDADPVKSVIWPRTENLPPEVVRHIKAGGAIHAWNAAFEAAILRDHYGLEIADEQFSCTMQRALAYGLPAALLDAGKAIRAARLKDESKRNLMLQMSRPRKGGAPWHTTDLAKLRELEAYCRDDVDAERAIADLVPELDPFERRLSLLDARINRKGVLIDRDAVRLLQQVAAVETDKLNAECAALTEGAVTSPGTQHTRLLMWLRGQGMKIKSVKADNVDRLLAHWQAPAGSNAAAVCKRALELRQLAAKSSLAKLKKMVVVPGPDGRARHCLQFYGAARTGRWAGRQLQPHNLPRPAGVKADQVLATAAVDADGLELLWGSPLEAISQALRGCFVAEPGAVLVGVDLSQIEARVLCWLAQQRDVLAAFARGEDVYTLAAAKVGSNDRQLGKVMTLGLGYQMGAAKFQDTAAKAPYYIKLSLEQAQDYVWAWRDGNPAIKSLWRALEDAFRESIANPGRVVRLKQCDVAVRTTGGVTQMKKPNGVKLTYHGFRDSDEGLVFWGVGLNKKWSLQKAYGGRLVENLVQSVARDVMAEAMLRAPDGVILTVHDEVLWEVESAAGLQESVNRVPGWAKGLPVASSQYVGVRYGK